MTKIPTAMLYWVLRSEWDEWETLKIKCSWMQVFPPWASSLSLGLHPLVSDTHHQCIRQTPASRVQTLCMHTDEPINRPFIPMTYYTLTSDRMWADCSNNISFKTIFKKCVYFHIPRTVRKKRKNASYYFSYVQCETQIYSLLSPLSALDMVHLSSVCQHFRGGKKYCLWLLRDTISYFCESWPLAHAGEVQ